LDRADSLSLDSEELGYTENEKDTGQDQTVSVIANTRPSADGCWKRSAFCIEPPHEPEAERSDRSSRAESGTVPAIAHLTLGPLGNASRSEPEAVATARASAL